MAKHYEVLNMLIPNGGYVQTGEEFEGIEFLECEPITKEQYLAGFEEFDAWKAQKASDDAAAKSALLARLGITENEARLLLS